MWQYKECSTPEEVCRLLDKHKLSKDDVIIKEAASFSDLGHQLETRIITVYWKSKDEK